MLRLWMIRITHMTTIWRHKYHLMFLHPGLSRVYYIFDRKPIYEKSPSSQEGIEQQPHSWKTEAKVTNDCNPNTFATVTRKRAINLRSMFMPTVEILNNFCQDRRNIRYNCRAGLVFPILQDLSLQN